MNAPQLSRSSADDTPADASAGAPNGAQSARIRTRPYALGPMPLGRKMITVDEAVVAVPAARIFDLARRVEDWPRHLAHYRFVRFRVRAPDGGGLVEMSANRPFGVANWPTWWLSEMSVDERAPEVRYRHVDGVTRGMDVSWTFEPARDEGGGARRLAHARPHRARVGRPRLAARRHRGRARRHRAGVRAWHRRPHARRTENCGRAGIGSRESGIGTGVSPDRPADPPPIPHSRFPIPGR